MSHLKQTSDLLGWLAGGLKERLAGQISVVDTMQVRERMRPLQALVRKTQHTAMHLLQLLEKLPLSSGLTESSPAQRNIHASFCQSRLKALEQAMAAEERFCSPKNDREAEEYSSVCLI